MSSSELAGDYRSAKELLRAIAGGVEELLGRELAINLAVRDDELPLELEELLRPNEHWMLSPGLPTKQPAGPPINVTVQTLMEGLELRFECMGGVLWRRRFVFGHRRAWPDQRTGRW